MFQAISQRINDIRRAATAQFAVDEAKTHVDIATDGYPAHLYEAINNRGSVSFADPVKRKAYLAAEGLKDIFFHVDDKNKEVSVESANKRLQDTDYYIPKFLDDTLEDLISNGKNAVIFNEDLDTLKKIAKLSRLDNQSYSNIAKLVIDKALEIQRKRDTQLTEAPTGESNVSLLLTGNDELQRFGSVISLLESSLDSSKFGVEVLNKTIPDEIKRLSASFREPMRSVVEDELKETVDKILKEPKAVLDDDETPIAVKSAILNFAQRAIGAAYPGNIEKDAFAQKVIALIGAEPGSETLRQAQNDLRDELLGDVFKLVDIDIALKKAETHLSNVTDSLPEVDQLELMVNTEEQQKQI